MQGKHSTDHRRHSHFFKMKAEDRRSLRYLGIWFLIACIAAVIGTLASQGFFFLLKTLYYWFTQPLNFIPLPVIAATGALITGGIFYRAAPEARGEGLPSYIRGVTMNDGQLDLKETFFKFCAGLFTIGFFGNGGIIGPIGRVSAGIMSRIGGFFNLDEKHISIRRTAAICGLSSVIAVVFHSPIGAGIFSVEILQKSNMRYRDLFPSIMTSALTIFLMESLHFPRIFFITPEQKFLSIKIIPLVLLTAVLTGFIGKLYNGAYHKITKWIKRDSRKGIALKTTISMTVAVLLLWPLQPELLGTGRLFFHDLAGNLDAVRGLFPTVVPLFAVMLILIFLKILGNILTVGSGLSAGFTSPIMLVGVMLGVAVADISGIEPYTADYFALLAAGFAGMLAGTMNIPIASAIIATEVFGVAYGFPAGVSSIISFQLNRHSTIYDYTRIRKEARTPIDQSPSPQEETSSSIDPHSQDS